MASDSRLQQLLSRVGVSKIVYALVMPETEATIDAVLDGSCDGRGRDGYHHRFREAWTQKQDAAHDAFFESWFTWTARVVSIDTTLFPFRYPTAGASEGIREAIHAYGAVARRDGIQPSIHLFEGEYEGYAAYARAACIPVVYHRRSRWRDAIQRVEDRDQFYISQPSAIDGMVWDSLDAFATELHSLRPAAELMLDLSYVGCVPHPFSVNANHPNIAAVFISLSKPAGVYYHRIGGMLARNEYLGLFGNKWFKNISSLAIGTEFMRRYGVHDLPSKYAAVQQQVLEEIRSELGLPLAPSDVFLLGIGSPARDATELERFLLRGPVDEAKVRVCLTARMAHIINPSLDPKVSPRYYEQIP